MEHRKYSYSSLDMENIQTENLLDEDDSKEMKPMKNVKRDSIRKQLFIIFCISIGQIIVGWSVGWPAPIIPKLQDPKTCPLPKTPTDLQTTWIASLLFIGSIIGPYTTSILANVVGRRVCLLIGGCLNTGAYLLAVTTNNIVTIYAVRVISGLGMGITTVGNIVYVGEIASTHIRGLLLTSITIMGIVGTLLVYAIGPFVSYTLIAYIAIAICLIHLLGIIFVVPESPVYHAMKNDDVNAANTLNMLGRSEDVEKLINAYAKKRGETSSNLRDWVEIVAIKSNRRSLFISFMLGAFQQASGYALVLFFSTNIFQWVESYMNPDLTSMTIVVTRLISSFIAPLLIENKGRRILLLISTAASGFSLSILGVYFYLVSIASPALPSIGWLPLVFLLIYIFSYEAGLGIIPIAIVGEMFRANVRANGSALAVTLAWLIGFGLTTSYTSMVNALGGDVTFWLFGGACILAFIFTYFFVPETKGKTLQEIQEMMS